MKIVNQNYPHPVLCAGNNDYTNCVFDIEIIEDPIIEGNTIKLKISYNLSCEGMKKMILEKSAKVVLYFESVIAEYRKIFAFEADKTIKDVVIDNDSINRNLLMKGYIIASKAMSSFSLPEQNRELLGTAPSSIRVGDILAVATKFFNIPLESYDPLADRPSIFCIRKQDKYLNEEVSADFSGSKITIWLNEETHNKYKRLYEVPDVRGMLASFFAVPVLVDVLTYMKNIGEDERVDIEDKKWYQVISKRLTELDITLGEEASLTKIANLILPHVFSTSIDSLMQLCEALLKGEEYNEN